MEDKSFELLTKMYSEFSARFESLENKVTEINTTVIKIENEFGAKLDILFDGYKQTGCQANFSRRKN
jgi:hypothetical protein